MTTGLNIPIEGMFDLAIARNTLRMRVAEQGWMPSFRARAGAALTAMAELILNMQPCGTVNLRVVKEAVRSGIVLTCDLCWSKKHYENLEEARSRLMYLVDELEIVEQPDGMHVVARIWVAAHEMP